MGVLGQRVGVATVRRECVDFLDQILVEKFLADMCYRQHKFHWPKACRSGAFQCTHELHVPSRAQGKCSCIERRRIAVAVYNDSGVDTRGVAVQNICREVLDGLAGFSVDEL